MHAPPHHYNPTHHIIVLIVSQTIYVLVLLNSSLHASMQTLLCKINPPSASEG